MGISNGKVSVIVPIYNQEKYLDKSVPSILNQSYKNVEVILVNDGSTDSSESIIQKYKMNDNRIVVVNKKNGGLVDATITGIMNATGEYVAFLDPDDYWGEDFLENLMSHMTDTYDFVAAGIIYDYGDKKTNVVLQNNREYGKEDIKWLRTHYLKNDSTAMPALEIYHSRWNKLYRKSCVDLFIDEFKNYKDITLGEDSIFTYLMLLNARGGYAMKKANTYYYNMTNPQSMMNDEAVNKYLDKTYKVYEAYKNLMVSKGDSPDQAYVLLNMLTVSFLRRWEGNVEIYDMIYEELRHYPIYCEMLKYLVKLEKNLKRKMSLIIRLFVKSPKLYRLIKRVK